MRLKKDSTEQKLRGAYYTPLRLANAMVNFFAPKTIATVLEPSCGDGVFLASLEQSALMKNLQSITAVEIDAEEAAKVKKVYEHDGRFNIYNEDFFAFYKRIHDKRQFDLILGNPPYIRYQYLTEEQRELQAEILAAHGMKANKLINSWVAFLVACVHLLSDKGKIAFVIPAEVLQVAYAEELRLFLSKRLQKITVITFKQLVFPAIEQEVVVFIGEKGNEEKGIRIIEATDLTEFEKLDLAENDFQKMQHNREKWTKYFVNANDLELIQRIRTDKRFARFSDFGLINIGITTGNNNYFSVAEETCREYGLGNVTLPLIGRSSHAHGIVFTQEDWDINKAAGKRARLVLFPDTTDYNDYPQEHKAYITLGEEQGIKDGYKCSIRDRWYVVPSVWAPDAFFLRRNNLYPKFVLNRCHAVSTDTMHRIKFKRGVVPENVLLSYYNSISFAFTEICGRSYGGGVLEILPGEMGNIMLPKIEQINKAFRARLLQRIDTIVRSHMDIEIALDIVDEEILVNLLGIDPSWCARCREIWHKLQTRRLGRAGTEQL